MHYLLLKKKFIDRLPVTETQISTGTFQRAPRQWPAGLIFHGGIEGNYLHASWSLPWCPWNALVEIYNSSYRCPYQGGNALVSLALSKNKAYKAWTWFAFSYSCFHSSPAWIIMELPLKKMQRRERSLLPSEHEHDLCSLHYSVNICPNQFGRPQQQGSSCGYNFTEVTIPHESLSLKDLGTLCRTQNTTGSRWEISKTSHENYLSNVKGINQKYIFIA